MANPFLSAYASERWINCPPSQLFCRGHDVQIMDSFDDRGDQNVKEGKECHQLAAYMVKKVLGQDSVNPVGSLRHYTQEMHECAEDYCLFVVNRASELMQQGANPVVYVEKRVDYTRFSGVDGSICIPDCIIVADGVLDVIDLKFGRGVPVAAECNTQLMIYALAALDLCEGRNVTDVRMTIVQSRCDNVHTYVISLSDLLCWASKVLYPAAKQAAAGTGEFRPGDHCRFCAVKAICRARVASNLDLAEFTRQIRENRTGMPATLTSEEISFVLARVNEFVTWASDIQAWATEQAVAGITVSGFKLVEGRRQRKYSDDNLVAQIVQNAGYEAFKKVLKNPAEMTRMMGQKRFDQLIAPHIVPSQGKPKLVQVSDKRPALSSAKEDFSYLMSTE